MTTLRPYLPDDAEALAILMQASIIEHGDGYTDDQREAWAGYADDDAFAKRLTAGVTLVALDEGSEPVGFAVLLENRAIAHVHVHPDLVGEGIGRLLVEALIKLATARGAVAISADATDNATGFFESLGFERQARQTVNFGDEWLGATHMEKPLKAPAGTVVQ